jgi:hypothetical protein
MAILRRFRLGRASVTELSNWAYQPTAQSCQRAQLCQTACRFQSGQNCSAQIGERLQTREVVDTSDAWCQFQQVKNCVLPVRRQLRPRTVFWVGSWL